MTSSGPSSAAVTDEFVTRWSAKEEQPLGPDYLPVQPIIYVPWWGPCDADFQGSVSELNMQSLGLYPVCERGTSDISSEIERVLRWLRMAGILIPSIADIRNYLLRFPDMLEAVPSICWATSSKFETRAQLSLELYSDPEIRDEYLTLYIRQDAYDADIMEAIEGLWGELEADLAGKSGWVLVTTDFQPPR